MEPSLPILYSFRRCPYAMRARLAIAVSGQACELREIVLRNKPLAMLQASPKGTVPVLIEPEGRVIDESLDIMLWALRRNDPAQWLQPETGSLAEMNALIAHFDDGFKRNLDRYKYPDRYPGADAVVHRTECGVDLLRLDGQLQSRDYLFGGRPALADMAVVPFVRQFAQTDLAWFEAQPWPRLQRWLTAITGSPLYETILEKFPVWEPGAPGVRFPPRG